MVANPFSRGAVAPARPRPGPQRPNRPYDPTRRKPLPRVEPLRPPAPVRPQGPMFPGRPPLKAPFGKRLPVPAFPISPMSRWYLMKFGLRALPWLNLLLTAYDLYILYQEWNKPGGGYNCNAPNGTPERWHWGPGHCSSIATAWVNDNGAVWSVGNPWLRRTQFLSSTVTWYLQPIEVFGPFDQDPGYPEFPEEGLPVESQPLPPLEVPYPYPFAVTPSPNLPGLPTKPSEESGPGYRPRPDNPLPPEVWPPAMPVGEPGPGVTPEPGAPVVPIAAPPRPHPNSPFPEWPFPGISPEVVPGPWPSTNPGGPRPIDPNNPNLPGVVPTPRPSIDLGGDPFGPPEVTPEPGLHYPIPTPRPERERKRRFSGKKGEMWNKLLESLGGNYMEFDDFIAALYKGIPYKYRRWRGRDGVWRDRDHTSDLRAQRIYEYFDKYNVSVGLEELAKMWATDKAIGKFGQALKKRTRDLGDKGLYQGASGLGRGTPLNKQDNEVRKKLIRDRYAKTRKDREYWRYIDMGTAGWFRQKRLRPDTEIPWLRRETRHVGSSTALQSYSRRGRGKSYYSSNRG